jgi:hypothetical protein
MTIKTNHQDQYANENIADFLYSEYSSSFSFQEDFRYLSLGYHEDELRGALLNEYTPQSPFDENLRKGNRTADKRARISRYTRAIFALTSTPVPRKQTHGSLFQKGHESFLLYAYGPLFEKGKYWHNNPEPYHFIKLLFHLASDGKVDLRQEQYANLFFMTATIKSAKWKVNEKVLQRLDVVPQKLMRTIFSFRS